MRPVRATLIFHYFLQLPLQGALIVCIRLPRALPWAMEVIGLSAHFVLLLPNPPIESRSYIKINSSIPSDSFWHSKRLMLLSWRSRFGSATQKNDGNRNHFCLRPFVFFPIKKLTIWTNYTKTTILNAKQFPTLGTVLINLILLRPELYNLLPMRKLIKSYNTHINYLKPYFIVMLLSFWHCKGRNKYFLKV